MELAIRPEGYPVERVDLRMNRAKAALGLGMDLAVIAFAVLIAGWRAVIAQADGVVVQDKNRTYISAIAG